MTIMNTIPTTKTVEAVRELLDWKPIISPLTYDFLGETRTSGKNVIVHPNTGNLLGVRGDSEPHYYGEWLVDNMELLTDDSLSILNYGELKGGAVAYVQVATDQILSSSGVSFRPFLTASTSLDGSFATCYKWNVQVIVCLNTFHAARKEETAEYRVKATKNSKFEVLKARQALDIMFEMSEDFEMEIAKLTSAKVDSKRFDRFVNAWTPLPSKVSADKPGAKFTRAEKKQNNLRDLWASDSRVSPWAGTEFGVLQAVNTFEHWDAEVRGMEREERNMLRTIGGEWDGIDAAALKLLATV